MRKIIIISFLILFAALVGIFHIQREQVDTDVTAKTTKVGVLLSGPRLDRSYCQSHYEALEAIKGKGEHKLNLDVVYREYVPSDCYNEIVSLVRDEGCRIVIGVSFDYGPSMIKAAEAYPDVYFLHAAGAAGYRHNLSTFFGRMYQARYLSGIVAGMKTKTGELGYVAAFQIPEVIRGINAFTLGVRSVRPDAVVHVRYCGSWVEDDPARKESMELLNRHPIDVMAMHTNSLAPMEEADKRGIWSIGYNLDNADLFPNSCLTSCVWNRRNSYYKLIKDCLQEKFHGDHVWIDMEEGIVGLSEFSAQVDPQTRVMVQAANDRLRSWEYDVFYGPIRDNTGLLRVDAGESMTDDEMLKSFDWYVEGVAVEGQGMGGA